MPEGPEIHRSADRIAEAILGHIPTEIELIWPPLAPMQEELEGQRIVSVTARGKALLIQFENRLTLYSHNQLYGVWYVRQNGTEIRTRRSLRLKFTGPKKTASLYSATDIALLDPDELAMHPYLDRLGPDVLDPETGSPQVLERYTSPRFRNRGLSALLLDQGFLAGLGNYLRSEILFVAGVHPDLRPRDCSPEQIERLAQASLELPRRSYQSRGITNDLERAEALKAQGVPRRHYRHFVFARQGQPCYLCQSEILKIEKGKRRLYYCPRCQRQKGRA